MTLLLLLPVLLALLVRLVGKQNFAVWLLLAYTPLQFLLVFELVLTGDQIMTWFIADAPARFFLLILSIVFSAISIASLDFLHLPAQTARRRINYVALLLLFHSALMAMILSSNLALLWIFLEATTLLSASFIYFENRQTSVEAAWKYLFICSVGIALAYVGVIFLAAAARPAGSLFFADLTRQGVKLNLFWLRLAFPFLVVGFATKAGLVPVHSWLPDAHAEAPAPISALLSGALLNGAMLAILRLQMVMDASGLAHTSGFLLILVGILSVFTAAACLRYVHNYKRMLAWSSVENMGIVVLGVGVGGAALFPTLLHILGHSLAKTACFLTAGWIHHQVDSKEIDESTGLFRRFPLLGSCWMASYSAISGFPPFLLFSSKIMLFSVLLDEGYYYLAASLAIALLIAICSLGQQVVTMVGGEVVENNQKPTADTQLPWSFIPIASLFLLLLIGSFYRPDFLEQLLNIAALVLSGGHDG